MPEPPSPPYIPAKYQGDRQDVIKRIVIHGTVSRTYCGGARAIAEYFQDPSYVSSAHYVVDPCAEFQMVFDHVVAWHDGTNVNSIGVELCDLVEGPLSRWNDEPHQLMLARAARLVRQLCLAYDIPMRKLDADQIRADEWGICGHNDMRLAFPGSTSHWDPGAFPWPTFIALTNQEDDMYGDKDRERDQKIARQVATIHTQVKDLHATWRKGIPKVRFPGVGFLTMKRIERAVAALAGKLAALQEAQRQHNEGGQLDLARIEAAAERGTTKALESGVVDVDITIADKTGDPA